VPQPAARKTAPYEKEAFWHWQAYAHGPLRQLVDPLVGPDYGIHQCGCYGASFREHLEAVLHALPRKSAGELRALVRALDGKILARAKVIQAESLDVPWWRGQL
jgi:hypothetical protein